MAFNIILEALTLAMHRLESLSDLAVRLGRLEDLDAALSAHHGGEQHGIDGRLGKGVLVWFTGQVGSFESRFVLRKICDHQLPVTKQLEHQPP